MKAEVATVKEEVAVEKAEATARVVEEMVLEGRRVAMVEEATVEGSLEVPTEEATVEGSLEVPTVGGK